MCKYFKRWTLTLTQMNFCKVSMENQLKLGVPDKIQSEKGKIVCVKRQWKMLFFCFFNALNLSLVEIDKNIMNTNFHANTKLIQHTIAYKLPA